MKKSLILFLSASAMSAQLNASVIDDLQSAAESFTNYDFTETAKAISTMSGADNVGMEAFIASTLKGSLYASSNGVNLVKNSLTSMTVEGFCNGNFDLPLNYKLAYFTVSTDELTARETKPDGTPGDYVGKKAKITPCIVIKNVVYVPLDLATFSSLSMPLLGYYADNDANGLDNLCFDTLEMPNLASTLLQYVDKDTLASVIKQAIQSQSSSSTLVSSVMNSIIDSLVDSDAIIALLDDAKFNAFKLEIYDDSSSTTEYYNGYELRSIEKTYDVTDRVITDIKSADMPLLGYGTKDTDNDVTRSYGIAYSQDSDGNVKIYNFNNSGLAIHTDLVTDSSNAKSFATTLHPVTGQINIAEGLFSLDDRQQLDCTPTTVSTLLNGNFNSLEVSLLWPVEQYAISSRLHPAWSTSRQITSSVTPSSIGHANSSRWAVNCGGELKTTLTGATISIGDYAPATSTYYALGNTSDRFTTNGPIVYDTTWTIANNDTESFDYTTDVKLNLTGHSVGAQDLDGTEGVWGMGYFEDIVKPDYVDHYDVYVVPISIDDVSKPYESALSNSSSVYKLDDEVGLQYRFKGSISSSNWTSAYLVTDEEHSRSYHSDCEFEFFIPFSEMTCYSYNWGWKSRNANASDIYTLFVKVTYASVTHLKPAYYAASTVSTDGLGQLEPTFHSLNKITSADNTITGVNDLEASDVVVDGSNGTITVENADNKAVNIYNLAGMLIHSATGNTNCAVAPGTYIVRVGSAVIKTSVK
jgi:hypothetical protein